MLAPEAGPRPARTARGNPGQPARPHRRGRARRLARRDRGTQGQPRRHRGQDRPDRRVPATPGTGRPPRHARVPRHRRPLRPARTRRNPVTTLNPRQFGDALRACARGIHPLEAGTGLLIDCGSWLHRYDFTNRFITVATSIAGGTPVSLNDTLPGVARRNASLVVSAVAHAAGLPDPYQETDKRYLN